MTKIVCISDTHNQHDSLEMPEGDVLIHAGDSTMMGRDGELRTFLKWFGSQPYELKILIAGNHDWGFEKEPAIYEKLCEDLGITYLNDSGFIWNGINFWGSPIQPEFFNWAFNRYRGPDIRKHWDMIPNNTDVLVTHGPPYGYLDCCPDGHAGCNQLLEALGRVQPTLHVFGHIHEGRGSCDMYHKDTNRLTTLVNAATLDDRYSNPEPPQVIRYSKKEKK